MKKQKTERWLKPIEQKDSWSLGLNQELQRLFYDVIYQPLIESEPKESKANAVSYRIVDGLKKGTISYRNGVFKAVHWNAALSKELKELGARWDKSSASFKLIPSMMPPKLRTAALLSEEADLKSYNEMMQKLEKVPEIMKARTKVMDLNKYSHIVGKKVDKQYKQTVIDVMSVNPSLKPAQRILFDEKYVMTVSKPIRKTISKSYGANVKKSANKFSDEEVQKLRKMVEQQIMTGRPRSELVDKIQSRLKIGKDRAKFIARQETSLFTAQYKQAQYAASEIDDYKWRTVGDGAVRHDHKKLNNTLQKFSDPPVTNEITGAKNNPGEDFNCRCVASPKVSW